MTQVLRGNIIQAPRLGELDIREHGYLVLEDGVVQGIYEALPQALASAPITDYGDRLIMQSLNMPSGRQSICVGAIQSLVVCTRFAEMSFW